MSELRTMDGLVTLREMPMRGMVTLRGDLGSAALQAAVTCVSGVAFPERGACHCAGERGVAWMSPDELLVICSYSELSSIMSELRGKLAAEHHLLQDVSDARVIYRLDGAAGREVLAKVCPVDLRPGVFEPGRFRRTRLAQVASAFWMRDAETFELIAFRSVADYVWDVLSTAADANAPVGHF